MNCHCSSRLGAASTSPVACQCLISRKIHGADIAARPIMIPATPDPIRSANVNASLTSPLPITGIFTLAATSAMTSQSAAPEYPCSFVRPCTADRLHTAAFRVGARS